MDSKHQRNKLSNSHCVKFSNIHLFTPSTNSMIKAIAIVMPKHTEKLFACEMEKTRWKMFYFLWQSKHIKSRGRLAQWKNTRFVIFCPRRPRFNSRRGNLVRRDNINLQCMFEGDPTIGQILPFMQPQSKKLLRNLNKSTYNKHVCHYSTTQFKHSFQ